MRSIALSVPKLVVVTHFMKPPGIIALPKNTLRSSCTATAQADLYTCVIWKPANTGISTGNQFKKQTPDGNQGMAGYTKIQSEYNEIEGEITYFVPKRDDCEIWMVKIKNVGNRPRRLASFSAVEWSLANYAFNLIEASFAQLFNEVYYENDTILVTTRFWNVAPIGTGNPNLRWDKYAFSPLTLSPQHLTA